MFTVIALLFSVVVQSAEAAAVQATPTASPVFINGVKQEFEAYTINGSNYFKLRDIAYALSGTAKQFEVSYSDLNNQVDLISNAAYTAAGTEMKVSEFAESVAATATSSNIYLDGVKLSLTAYIICESNFIKLRDIAAAINFDVRYIQESSIIEIDTATVYTPVPLEITFPCDLSVTFIGDSVGAGVAPYLKKYFPNMYIDAKASRQFYQAKSIIEKLLQEEKLSSTVVIGLGTNGTVKETDVRALIELIGKDRKLVFVNCRVPRSWCEGDNKTFTKVVAEFANTIIADWYSASAENDQYFYKDGFHPNNTGCTVLAKTIADAVVAIQPYSPYQPIHNGH